MRSQSIFTRPSRTAAVFACALLATLTFAASHQAAASSAATPVISAGGSHSCGVTASGEGLCWGGNLFGQTSVPGGKTWASITAGEDHTCGVTTSGEGLCWGRNVWGQSNVPAGKTWASITTGYVLQSCGVTTSGEGLCWGGSVWGQANFPAGKTWASITAGNEHSCGVTTSGEGLCWGYNGEGQTNVPTGKTWSSITSGGEHSCGVTTSGEGLCWGYNHFGQTSVPGGKTWASFTAGLFDTCGVTTSGEGLCWGYNTDGRANVPTGKTWASITTGIDHSCGVTTGGEGLCWGFDGHQDAYGYDYDKNGDFTGPNEYYVAAVPPDGRLDVPVGKFDAVNAPSDTTAPDAPSVSAAPTSPTNNASASFTITGEANATFTCSVDGASYAACTSPLALSDLTDGDHTVLVKQTDEAGNTSTETSKTWTVDTTPPAAPTVSGAPSGSTTAPAANLTFAGEANATFLCSVDGADYAFCSSPLALSRLSTGEHVVLVKQTDEAGNTSVATTKTWTIRAGCPKPTIRLAFYKSFGHGHYWLSTRALAGDARPACQLLTIQVWDSQAKPADSDHLTDTPSLQLRILKYASLSKFNFGKTFTPRWIRVENKVGTWSNWYQLSQGH